MAHARKVTSNEDEDEPNGREKLSTIQEERSILAKVFGRSLVFLTVISFLFVGLFINFLQLILFWSFKLSSNQKWKSFHKRLNGHLLYYLFSPCIFLAYYWSNMKLNIQLDDMQLVEDAKGPIMGLMIPNHSYEIDYIVCFVLADQLGNLGSYKSLSKYELKFLPVIGWALWMGDMIFVRRNWRLDRPKLGQNLARLFDYDQFLLGLFAEGTRFTKEKHEISKAFAQSKGIKPLKYHLQPRSRGFNYTIRYYLKALKDSKVRDINQFRIFNLQIIMPPNLTFSDFLNGVQLSASVYCEEVKLSETLKEEVINSKDEDDCPKLNKLLDDIYRRKDELVDQFKANGNKFLVNSKKGGEFPYKIGRKPLIVWAIGFCLTYATFGYFALFVYAKSLTFWTIVITFVTGCSFMLKQIEKESETKSLSICSNQLVRLEINADNRKIAKDNIDNNNSSLISAHAKATFSTSSSSSSSSLKDNNEVIKLHGEHHRGDDGLSSRRNIEIIGGDTSPC